MYVLIKETKRVWCGGGKPTKVKEGEIENEELISICDQIEKDKSLLSITCYAAIFYRKSMTFGIQEEKLLYQRLLAYCTKWPNTCSKQLKVR